MVAVAWMGATRLSVIAALTAANGTVQLFTPGFWTVSGMHDEQAQNRSRGRSRHRQEHRTCGWEAGEPLH